MNILRVGKRSFFVFLISMFIVSLTSCDIVMQESRAEDIASELTLINKAYTYSNPEYYVSLDNIKDVTISIENDMLPMFITALDEAILIWNSIPECAIHLRKVSSGGDINITYTLSYLDNLGTPDWALARGIHPSNGDVGSYININKRNEAFFNSEFYSELKAIRTMAHEIGHTIGFHHNYPPASDGLHIPGTDTDELSVMSSAAMSDSDILGAQILYPGPPEWPGSKDNPIQIEQYTWDQIVDLSHGYAWVEMELNQYPSGAGWQIHHTNNGQFNVNIEDQNGSFSENTGTSWSYAAQANKQNRLVKITYVSGSEQILIQCW